MLFRVALVLLRSVLGSRAARKRCPSMFETLDALKSAPSAMTDPDQLVEEVGENERVYEVMDHSGAFFVRSR